MDKTNIQPKKAAISLRKYTPEELEKTLNSIREAYNAGLIESADMDRFLLDFKFRDSARRYWTIGIQTGKWYCKTNLGWVEFARPIEPLEALADLKLTSYMSEPPPLPNDERAKDFS
jgi:hypothetical protein